MIFSNLERRQMREYAFAYLTKYKPSSGKLRNYLLEKNYPQAEIDTLIAELSERHYLDDFVLASKILLAYRGTKSRGKAALRIILLKRGIEKTSCELALSEFFNEHQEKDLLADFLASSCQVLFREFSQASYDKLEQRKILHRITAKCLRRGFNASDIKHALLKQVGSVVYMNLRENL